MTFDKRIKNKQKDIEKCKKLILNLEKKIEIITDEFDLVWVKNDLRTSNKKLIELKAQLENLIAHTQQAKEYHEK